MIDNDIIKALECCSFGSDIMCNECPADDCSLSCGNKLAKEALDLINRQQAEIESLKEALKDLRIEMSYMSNPNTIGYRQEMGCW